MSKKQTLGLLAATAVGGLLFWYLNAKDKQSTRLPIETNAMGSVHLSAATLERMVYQLLNTYKNVRPRRVRVHIERGDITEISAAVQLRKSRFSTPSMDDLQHGIRERLSDWTGVELPSSAIRLETIGT